ncbi:RbsD/FucU domain-containing protein [Luteipulveratus sp. YIM 133132]|uniref:RbsD/FucU domain-containing protein n=1 Tax=Luteipulveratus flavus TaxID=3031728 RepID=A0ABT6C4P2_9MICO|nr:MULTISPECIES: RbsD/FucU domain-containing protein [unclassified Luteipulveratus]MDE9365407.1 RbsD/FucU domain-containing protein [Luteipulveratus sp. YIM 133132]MDF8263909.1 RbsD/FucU domain-containing protein [Luteipulveratus sp. YIM 133296]
MLRFSLIHPQILSALAAAGHGSTVLVADANYAHSTGTNPAAPVVQLNLSPGLVSVAQVLSALVGAAPFERARLMAPDDGSASPCAHEYGAMLGPQVPVEVLPRVAFRDACRGVDHALTIATGDDRYYANVLLTIGAVPPRSTRPD